MNRLFLLMVTYSLSSDAFSALDEEATKTTVVEPLSAVNVMNMVGSLFLVLALIFVLSWLVKRWSGLKPNAATALSISGGINVGSREKIVIVQVEGRRLLVGITPSSMQTLCELEANDDIESQDTAHTLTSSAESNAYESQSGKTFAGKLMQMIQKAQQDGKT